MALFNGTDGNDVLNGGAESDDLIGLGGDDQLSGGDGIDRIEGGAGADTLNGGAGDDRISSHLAYLTFYERTTQTDASRDSFAERDIIDGGDGDDLIAAGYGDTVNGSAGLDTLIISFLGAPSGVTADFNNAEVTIGGGTISGFEATPSITGSNFDDVLISRFYPDFSFPYYSRIMGEGGNDRIIADSFNVYVSGGDGDDEIDALLSGIPAIVEGGAGNDIIRTGQSTTAYGQDGNDTIHAHGKAFGGAGNDILHLQPLGFSAFYAEGGDGDDQLTIEYFSASMVLVGGAGADTLTALDGNDVLTSGASHYDPTSIFNFVPAPPGFPARLITEFAPVTGLASADTGAERDTLSAGAGQDSVSAGFGDTADGGEGPDTLGYSFAGSGVGVTVETASLIAPGGVTLGGGTLSNFEKLAFVVGSNFDDTITVSATTSDLTVQGGGGNDTIRAGGETSHILGGAGDDLLYGGAGADIFYYRPGNLGADTIFDFGANDKLDLSALLIPDLSVLLQYTRQIGNDVKIALNFEGAAFSITLKNLTIAQITAANVALYRVTDQLNLVGTEGDDSLFGNLARDTLNGLGGNDLLIGGESADRLDGGAGDDTLIPGLGPDFMTGGAGNDTFFIDSLDAIFEDTITDFTQGDKIDLSPLGLNDFSMISRLITQIGPAVMIRTVIGTTNGLYTLLTDSFYPSHDGRLVLEGVAIGDLDASDFVLTPTPEGKTVTSARDGALVLGSSGPDRLTGGVGAQMLLGGLGDDLLAAGDGNDALEGNEGADTLDGGAGDDLLFGNEGDDILDGGADSDKLYGHIGNDRLNGGAGQDELYGGDGADTLIGGDAADYILGEAGDDVIEGGADWDHLYGNDGDDQISGGLDRDSLYGGTGNDRLSGDAGNDEIFGEDGDDTLDGGDGDDLLNGWIGRDVLRGGAGNDRLEGVSDNDMLYGEDGQDTLVGEAGDDTLFGGDGADVLNGGLGIDRLYGDAGDDTLLGDNENDFLDGGDGNDRLTGGDGNDVLEGGAGDDTLDGSVGDDILRGGDGNDRLDGHVGNNTLDGGAGVDLLIGQFGNDIFIGHGDGDTFNGNSGIDVVRYAGLARGFGAGLGGDKFSGIEEATFLDAKLTFDPDSNAAFVMRLYDSVLLRAPDAAGLDHWLDEMDAGVSKLSVAQSFLNSTEFRTATQSLSNADFVEYLFVHSLGRASDASGKAFWVNRLATDLTRADVLMGFSESDEHRALTVDRLAGGLWVTDQNFQDIALLYDGFTNRLPDQGGLLFWTDRLDNGVSLQEVANGFAASTEFTQRTSGFSNADLVEFMYVNTLDRASDAAGKANWIAALDGGMTRGELLLSFALSPEHETLLSGQIQNGVEYLI